MKQSYREDPYGLFDKYPPKCPNCDTPTGRETLFLATTTGGKLYRIRCDECMEMLTEACPYCGTPGLRAEDDDLVCNSCNSTLII